MFPSLPLLPKQKCTAHGRSMAFKTQMGSLSAYVPPATTARKWDFAFLFFPTAAGDRGGSSFPQTPACLPPLLLPLSPITDHQLMISSPCAYLAPPVPGVGWWEQGSSFPGLGIFPKARAAGLGQQGAPHSWEEGRRRARAAGLTCLSPFLLDDPPVYPDTALGCWRD